MSEPKGDGLNHVAAFTKELIEAIRESEQAKAAAATDPLKSLRFLLPLIGLLVSGLIYGGIIWAKVGAIESKMAAVDSINVVAAQVVSLQQQMRTENERLASSQARLEDRIEKLIEQQNRRDRLP